MSYQTILQMALSGIVPSLITATFLYFLYWKKYKQHSIAVALFAIYVCMLLYVTIYRHGISFEELFRQRPNVNFTPLISTYQLYEYGGWTVFWYNIIGNIIWFLPFGYLLPSMQNRFQFSQVLSYSFLLSFGIELTQFLLNCGISDIDDIIFNVIGGCVGYGCYCIIGKNKKSSK